MTFKVAIIGRPNVGKSSIFNRLTGRKDALVHDKPGLTRDRKEGKAQLGDLNFTLIDTAGLEKAETGTLEELMMQQTNRAIQDADVILMTIDGREGVTNLDHHFAKMVRKYNKPTIMVVNKAENERKTPGIDESYKLGFGAPAPISAEHGVGLAELYDRLAEMVVKHDLDSGEDEFEEKISDLQICILGRPNVGKSTLFNTIIGDERSISSTFSGTTRDSIYYNIDYLGTKVQMVDTAGIRKRAKREDLVEELSVSDTMKALQYANVAILVLDATVGMDKMDLHIAGEVLDNARAMVIAVNKWDALDEQQKNNFRDILEEKLEFSLSQAKSCPVIFTSALTGDKVNKILEAAMSVYAIWNSRVSTGKLNRWLKEALEINIPPLSDGKRIKFKYITQVKSRPPTFTIFTSSAIKGLPDSYLRYLRNSADKAFDLKGVPVRFIIRKSDNPFEGMDRDREKDYS